MSSRPIFVVGRFPPPFDGQSLATARCADLLDGPRVVHRFNTEPPGPSVYHPDPRPDPRRTWFFLRHRGRLRRALAADAGAPVLWHSVSPTTLGHLRDAVATLPAFGARRPVYPVLHRATFERLFRSPLTQRSARALVRRVSGFVFQSEHLADRCADVIPSGKRVVIPHTIDEAVACTADDVRQRIEAGPGRPLRLLFLSNMIREKGYLDVVEAAAKLRGRGTPFHLDMAGSWPSDEDRSAFDSRLRESGLTDAVVHHGGVHDRAVVRRLHLAADLFLLPTYHPTETQPIAILEALGAGTPVISVDRPILHDILPGGVGGALVPPRAPDALADAIERLAEPVAWVEAATAARARYETAFAPEAVRERWLSLLAGAPRSVA